MGSEFEFCDRALMQKEWRLGIPVSHLHLRVELVRSGKPPKTYECPRCGQEIMK